MINKFGNDLPDGWVENENDQCHFCWGVCREPVPTEWERLFYTLGGPAHYGHAYMNEFAHFHTCPYCNAHRARWIRQGWCVCLHCGELTTFEEIRDYEYFLDEQRKPDTEVGEFYSELKGRPHGI